MSQSEQLANLLLYWDDLRRRGEHPRVEDLCSECPELADELARRIRALEKLEFVLGLADGSGQLSSDVTLAADTDRTTDVSGSPAIPGYEVIATLGKGGMGVVFKARHLELGRIVALKTLSASLIGTRQLQRFRDEARAVARLHHPHIVQIYDVGEADGVPYFSMEYVDGGSLQERLAAAPLEIDRAVQLIKLIANAVHSVHVEGFAHRDLKPANILLTSDAQPKVTDFGLAKRLEDDEGHTRTGEILGTIGYMAPEQLDQSLGSIGHHTDVYALGVLFYELLTGKQAFAAQPAVALRQALHEDVPLPRDVQPNVPQDLEAICVKCLEKDPSDRYESAAALAHDLQQYTENRPISARRVGATRRMWKWLRRHPQVTAVSLIFLFLLASWRVVALVQDRQERVRRRAEAVRLAPLAREILHRNCYSCHGADPDNVRRNLDVLNHHLLLDSERGNVVPDRPGDSRLIQRIADGSMPPVGEEKRLPRLAEEELDILNRWILGGAPPFPVVDPKNPTRPVVEFSRVALDAEKVLQDHCYRCHRHDRAEGGIRILHHRLLLHVRKVVVPGSSGDSELFDFVTGKTAHPFKPLLAEEIEKVRRWIDNGAMPFPKSDN